MRFFAHLEFSHSKTNSPSLSLYPVERQVNETRIMQKNDTTEEDGCGNSYCSVFCWLNEFSVSEANLKKDKNFTKSIEECDITIINTQIFIYHVHKEVVDYDLDTVLNDVRMIDILSMSLDDPS